MLVLMRRADEQIQIGPDICITVVAVKGSGVRLGIEAPKEVQILRGELLAREQGETPAQPTPVDHAVAGKP
jgi:carbon storage regulator